MSNKKKATNQQKKEHDHQEKPPILQFFEQDYVSVEVDNNNQWIYANWKGYQSEASVKAGCEKILEALIHYKYTKVLNDNSHVLGIWTPASSWVGSNWFPRMENAGLKHFAWVYSPAVFSQVSTNESLKYVQSRDIISTFYDIDTAKNWLSTR